ncbi:MAG: transglycosylase domain-containing protein, partial [Clostridium sp.]|nr:transglycosylase domain-containing protein [Clostridium sp.]
MNKKPTKKLDSKSNVFINTLKFFKFIMITLVILALVGGLYASKVIYGVAKDSPDLSLSQFIDLNEPSIVVDDEGNEFDIIHTDEVRFPLELSEMGENVKNAFISIEDERFEKHKGVDYRRTISVSIQDVLGRFTGQRNMQGGSTITQQLIKNTYLTKEKSITRKIKEMYMALETEKMVSKEQILETYLNRIFLGGKAHGVEAAANQYFDKSAKDLSIIEAAYIAGTTQSPTNYYAFSDSS